MAGDQQERTEKATTKRRQDYREKGQVAQSKEVHTAALMIATLMLWTFYAPYFWQDFSGLLEDLWRHAGHIQVTPLALGQLATTIIVRVTLMLVPVLLMVLVVGFFSSFLQIGWLFSTKALKPDFTRLDPIKGAAKFVSKRSAVELLKSLAKVLLVMLVAYQAIRSEFQGALLLVDMDVVDTVRYLGRVSGLILLKSCGVLVVLAVLDYVFVRFEMEEKMKMTKQEQKEEFKETEGDPHLKGRIRSIQQQMARKRMMAEVPNADVVITNPTHLSVAIAYRRENMRAPHVVAKGADNLALKIREIAAEHGVPQVENVPVARALYQVDLDAEIPEEMFKAVAEVLAYVYNLKGPNR
ncbi:MAG TPA: flagellar biosynthesis protein FlhB [Desulfuromonadales bacterium]|nr:flagellar biosynthesis protein FlhB [Desulfuromonadales bacterium]